MNQPHTNPIAQKFEKLTNLFYLMVGLPLLVFIWIYLNLPTISPWEYFGDGAIAIALHGLILFAAIFFAIAAFVQYRRRFTGLEPYTEAREEKEALEEKTDFFYQASLKKYLLLTASTVLVILGFYLSAEEFYGGCYALLLIAFSINRPTPEKMAKDMRLKKEERKTLVMTAKPREKL